MHGVYAFTEVGPVLAWCKLKSVFMTFSSPACALNSSRRMPAFANAEGGGGPPEGWRARWEEEAILGIAHESSIQQDQLLSLQES